MRAATTVIIPKERLPPIWQLWMIWSNFVPMGRPRKSNKHLPSRMYQKHNAFYFVDADNKWHRLGRTLAEAYRGFAEFCPGSDVIKTMNDLADKYQLEVIPSYRVQTQKNKAKHLERIRAVFGHMPLADITARGKRVRMARRAARASCPLRPFF